MCLEGCSFHHDLVELRGDVEVPGTRPGEVTQVFARVRRHLWGQGIFPTSPADPGVVLAPRSLFERLSLAVCQCIGNVPSQAKKKGKKGQFMRPLFPVHWNA